jgi:hypothetical protein
VGRRFNARDIHKEIFPVYGWKCLSHKVVHNRLLEILSRTFKVTGDANPAILLRLQQVQLQWVEELIEADRSITVDSAATALGCSHGLTYTIMHDRWNFWKVRTQCVPRELKG